MEALFRRRFFVVHLVLLALCAILLARVVNVFVGRVLMDKLAKPDAAALSRPAPPPKPVSSRDFDAASTSNIFEGKRENLVASEGGAVAPPVEDCFTDECLAAAPHSTTRLRLVGTAVFSMSEFSLASIIDEAKAGTPAESYSTNACAPVNVDVGDPNSQLAGKPRPCNKINDSIILKRIEPERAYLLNDGHLEYIAIGEPPAKAGAAPVASAAPPPEDLGKDIKRLSETNYEVGQNEVDKALGNLAGLASDARIVPAFEGGKSTGFKMFSIRPGSLYSKIGLQNGDVVTRINGYEISSPDKALEIYQKLKDSKHVTVDLTRRGKPSTMEYNITP